MGLGIATAAGIQGGYDTLDHLLQQRMQQEAIKRQVAQQQFENQRQLAGDQRAQQAQTIEQQRYAAQMAERQGAADAAQGDKLNESIPGDTRLDPNDRAVGFLRSAGVPLQPVPGVAAMGPDFQGPMPNGVTPQQAQTGIGAGFLKTASAHQAQAAADEQRRQAQVSEQQARDAETARHNRADENKPASGGSFQLQPEIDLKTGQQTGRFLGYNTKTNSWEPVKGQGPQATKAPPGAAQEAEKEKSKVTARTTLDRLDQDIDTAGAKGLIGPSSGRISDVEQWVGNNDPAISTLASRMVAAKMLVDAGIGGMRGAASPGLMARWDKLMGLQATPENLHAVSQVMREMVGGAQQAAPGGGGTVAMVAPDGRALSVPADKVAELEAKGAKRR